MQQHKVLSFAMLVAFAAGCGGNEQQAAAGADSTRDLSLPPAESVSAMNDQPATKPSQPVASKTQPPAKTQPAKPKAPPAPPTVETGTVMMLAATDTITSRTGKKGDPVQATIATAVKGADGREVIPAGAVFLGTVSELDPAPNPSSPGKMQLTFNRVRFGGHTYAVQARTDSLATVMKGRGVTKADAAKVGAGAVVGAIAGRVIGGNKTGTVVGAAAGAAAGAGVAAASRDIDIVLPAGAPITIELTAPFTATPID